METSTQVLAEKTLRCHVFKDDGTSESRSSKVKIVQRDSKVFFEFHVDGLMKLERSILPIAKRLEQPIFRQAYDNEYDLGFYPSDLQSLLQKVF